MIPLSRTYGAVAASMTIVLAVCACGGGKVKRLSQPEFQTAANAACRAARDDLARVPAPRHPIETAAGQAETVAAYGKAAPIAERFLKELRRLRPSDAVADDAWGHWLALEERQLRSAKSAVDAIRVGNLKAGRAFAKTGGQLHAQGQTYLLELELTECLDQVS